jgi:hypothetical protein
MPGEDGFDGFSRPFARAQRARRGLAVNSFDDMGECLRELCDAALP